MKILSMIVHPRTANTFIAEVTGLKATHITVKTEMNGNRLEAYSGYSSTGPSSRYFKSYNRNRNEKMLNAFTDFLNA